MADEIACSNCGARVTVPAAFARPKIRCPGCGYYATLPDRGPSLDDELPTKADAAPAREVRLDRPAKAAVVPGKPAAKPAPPAKARPDPRDRRPDFTPAESSGVPLLVGTRDEDDDQPYAVPGTGLFPCPHCREDLPLDSTFCVHCGKSLGSGERAERVHQPMAATWEERFPLTTRLYVLAGMQVLNFVGCIFGLMAQSGTLGSVDTWVSLLMFQMFHVALQCFVVGTFDTLTLARNAKGRTTLIRQRRVAFYKLKPYKIPWRQSTNVGIVGGQNADLLAWFVCLYMLGFACLPGLLFYWFMIRPERFEVTLCDEYGVTGEVIHRTTDRARAEEVAEFVQEATGLHNRSVM